MRGKGQTFSIGAATVIAVVLLALVLEGADVQLLSMVGPKIIAEWRLTTSQFAPSLASAALGFALGAGLGGWLGDRRGHRQVFLSGLLLCAGMTASTAFVSDIHAMTLLRLFTGMTIGIVSASALVMLAQLLTGGARTSVSVITSACSSAGGMLGSAVVYVVEPAHGWRGCFVALGLALLVATFVLLLLGSRATKASGPSAGSTSSASLDNARSSIFTADLTRINMGAPAALFACLFLGYSFAWTPVILTKSGLSLGEAIFGYLSYNVAALVAPLIAAPVILRLGTRAFLIIVAIAGIAVATALGFVLDGNATAPTLQGRTLIYAGIAGMGAVSSTLSGAVYAVLANGYPGAARGRGVGLAMMIGRFGGLLAILVGGVMLDGEHGPRSLFHLLAASLILAVGAALLIDRHTLPQRKIAGSALAAVDA